MQNSETKVVMKRGELATKKKNKEIEDEEEKKAKNICTHQILELLVLKMRLEELLASLKSDSSEAEDKPISQDVDDYYGGNSINAITFLSREWRQPNLNNVMEALSDPNIHIIGIYGTTNEIGLADTPLVKVCRRVDRDKLFDVVLSANVTKKPNIRQIQDEIAGQLRFNFNEKKCKSKRGTELFHRIKNERKVLVILCDMHEGVDLGKMGIPFGEDHRGCKILVTSATLEVLSKHMRSQKIVMA